MKITYVIASPEWDARRHDMLAKLEAQIAQQLGVDDNLYVHRHQHRDSHLPGCIEAITQALLTNPDWIVTLPDDAILIPHYVEVMRNIIKAKPDAIIDGLSNHEAAPKLLAKGCDWYTTDGGTALFGAAMHAADWREVLLYRERALSGTEFVPIDDSVNMWASVRGHRIWKPLPSPVQHDLSLGSLNGNEHQDKIVRTSNAWDPTADLRAKTWNGPAEHIGRTYEGQHWRLVFNTKPDHQAVEAAYRVHRGGTEISTRPHVLIATPAYQPPELTFLSSRDQAVQAMVRAGIQVTVLTTAGDSLVTRGRHCLVHEFLSSTATHLLQWDADIELLTPEAPIEMVRRGLDVVGGAYPFRDGSGRVVINVRDQDLKAAQIEIDEFGFMPIAEIGTGFLMTSRKAILDLIAAHPDRLYEADIQPYQGCPMWSIFDAGLRPHPMRPTRMRYLSEDWEFCRLWREQGNEVYCHTGAQFRHWGKIGHTGTIQQALNMRPVEKQEAAE